GGGRGWGGGRSSPPPWPPPRWPSPPAGPRPAPSRWELHAPRPPSHSMPRSAAEADALRAGMIGAAAKLARPVEPRLRSERAGLRAAALPAGPAGGSADRCGGRAAPPVPAPPPLPPPPPRLWPPPPPPLHHT